MCLKQLELCPQVDSDPMGFTATKCILESTSADEKAGASDDVFVVRIQSVECGLVLFLSWAERGDKKLSSTNDCSSTFGEAP